MTLPRRRFLQGEASSVRAEAFLHAREGQRVPGADHSYDDQVSLNFVMGHRVRPRFRFG